MTQIGSTRFDGDTWDLASSVGLTATMVAAARAVASCTPGALVNDQFAAPLVRAVGVDFFARLASGELEPSDLDEDAANGMRRFADAMAIRTRYFDEFFLDATRAGVRQAVILASGLDSRAYRLPWPSGTAVFEVDQPQVIEFKSTTLARGTGRGRIRPGPAHRLDRRGPAGLSARRGPGSAARPDHGPQRAGQPVRHRRPARHQPAQRR
jgi:O-methyltransferase involved in polyketide biosynthesis